MVASWWSPETDGGVLVQVIVTVLLGVALTLAVRRERSLVLIAIGMTLVVLGWYGIRGLH